MKTSFSEVSQEVFRESFLRSQVAGYFCDHEGYVSLFNEAAVSLWGRRPEPRRDKWCGAAVVYRIDGTLVPPDQHPLALVVYGKRPPGKTELLIERPDGSRRHILAFLHLIHTDDERVAGGYATLIDITDHKEYDERQAMLSAIVQSSDDAIISKTLDGRITSWNTGAERIFGYQEHEIVGKSIYTLFPTYLKGEEQNIIRELKAGNRIQHYQTIRLTKAGREIPISLTISPIRDREGNIIGASKIARDISERIQREQTIQYHAQQLETLHAIGRVISEKLDTHSLIRTVIDSTTHLAAADIGLCFYRVSDEQGQSKLSVALAAAKGDVRGDVDAFAEEGIIHTIFSSGEALRFDDLAAFPHIQGLFGLAGRPDLPMVRHCLAVPIRAAEGLLIGAMFFGYADAGVFASADERTMRNIASLVAVTLDNARLFEEVTALNFKKNEFIALASHELKTPLTTVKGYLQILERSEIDQVGRRFLNKALKQLERINALIAELLDISRIEAGKLSFHFERFNLAEMVLDVIETFHFSSQTHTVVVNNTRGDFIVEADRQRMEQVFINLITNAIKYSPDANTVYVNLEPSAGEVTIQVTDEGLGLTREQQERVFTRFYQVDGTSKMTGLGLGLYLSKEIIERHGGHIGVNSQLGKGSTFYFSIPRKQTERNDL